MYLNTSPTPTRALAPALTHDPSKNSIAFSPPSLPEVNPTQQGTFWCEAWKTNSSETIASNKILVTLSQWETFVITLVLNREVTQEKEFLNIVGNAFSRELKSFQEMFKDRISMKVESHGKGIALSEYKFHLYMEKHASVSIENKLVALNRIVMEIFAPGSSVKLATACSRQNIEGSRANTITWPYKPAGPIYPERIQCQDRFGLPIPGKCSWNFTHGGEILPSPEDECTRYDVCPGGYTNVNTTLCISVTESVTWETGIEKSFRIGREMDISQLVNQNTSQKFFGIFRDLLLDFSSKTATWVAMKRMRRYGPIVSIIFGNSPKELSPWASGHPKFDKDCVAFDLANHYYFTLDCYKSLPFLVAVDLEIFEKSLTSRRSAVDWNLVRRDPQCDHLHEDAVAPVQSVDTFLCILPRMHRISDWDDAKNRCQDFKAHLPQPSAGFLNWVYKKLMRDYKLSSAYMILGNSNGSVKIDDASVTTYNWIPETNLDNLYGVIGQSGWSLVNSSNPQVNGFFCEFKKTETRQSLRPLQIMADQDIGELLMHRVNENKIDVSTVQCFKNGKTLNIEVDEISNEALRIYASTSLNGNFQCFAWSKNPRHWIASNNLFILDSEVKTFVVKFLNRAIFYNVSTHDATFYDMSDDDSCSWSLRLLILDDNRNYNISGESIILTPAESGLGAIEYVSLEVRDALKASEVEDYVADLILSSSVKDQCEMMEFRPADGCPRDIIVDSASSRRLTFESTPHAGEFISEELCSDEKNAPVSRTCLGDFNTGYFWSDIFSGCTATPSNVTKMLYNISRNVRNYEIGSLSNATSDGENLHEVDIHYVAKTLKTLEEAEAQENEPLIGLDDIVTTVNNVLLAPSKNFQNLHSRLNSTNIILNSLENLAFKNSTKFSGEEASKESSKSLISVKQFELTRNSTVIGYEDLDSDGGVETNTILSENRNLTKRSINVQILLPRNLTRELAESDVNEENVKLTFMVFRDGKLFVDEQSESLNYSLNSYIIQASYKGKVVRDHSDPVQINFRPLHGQNNTKCVFWDFELNNRLGGWSKAGCTKHIKEDYLVTCLCNHLTSFALLINFDNTELAREHAIVLEYITMVGGSLSIIGLLLVFVTFGLFKKWRRRLTNKILLNLSISVFFSMVIFLLGISQTQSLLLCRGVAVALHYFILASFGWMLVEGVHQYLKFVKVIGTYIPKFLWKASICAWGLPVVPIVCLLVYDSRLYDSHDAYNPGTAICWISPTGFKFAFLPPLVLTMTINITLYGLIINGAICRKTPITSTMSQRDALVNQLSMAVCVFFLLGFTWIFGLLAITDARIVFSYLFCIFNTLQGFFIFLFHVCRERSVRRLYASYFSVTNNSSSNVHSTPSGGGSSHSRYFGGTIDSRIKSKNSDSPSRDSPIHFTHRNYK